jgi:hypothetical protein
MSTRTTDTTALRAHGIIAPGRNETALSLPTALYEAA